MCKYGVDMAEEGKYFVVNEDENDTAPRKIYFVLEDAKLDGALFIDAFNEKGDRIYSLNNEKGDYEKLSA